MDLLAAMAGIERALGDEPIDAAEFLQTLIGLAQEERLGGGGEPLDGVAALSIMDARGLDFDVVHVLGLDDGTFPAARREGVLLPDWLKRSLNPVAAEVLHERLGSRAAGLALGGVLRPAREASLEAPFLFFLALSLAEHEVVLSHPAAVARGNPPVRSPFVEEVERQLVGGLPTRVHDAAEPVPLAGDCCDELELLEPRARQTRQGKSQFHDYPCGDGRRQVPAADRRCGDQERTG
jgi:ATP-dependent helicase/DNAse subunit B